MGMEAPSEKSITAAPSTDKPTNISRMFSFQKAVIDVQFELDLYPRLIYFSQVEIDGT